MDVLTIFRSETFEQHNGSGVLELRGGSWELALFGRGKPLVFDFSDCSPSIGRFTVLLDDPPQWGADASIAARAAAGFRGEELLSEQIKILLDLLPNGRYRLTLEESDYAGFAWADFLDRDAFYLWYYPSDDGRREVPVLLTTQCQTDEEAVLHYTADINQEHHPALITIGAPVQMGRFVLDGHHKLQAYWRCRRKPTCLHIECESVQPISLSEAKAALGQENYALDYLKWKAHVDGNAV